MQPWPDTHETLLTRLSDPQDQAAWQEFVGIYQPVVYRLARRRGLQDADAADVTQRVLWSVARAADRWQPGKEHGRFRGWLATVTSNAVINLLTRERWRQASGRTTVLELLNETAEPNNELNQIWLHERRLQLFRSAAESVKQEVSEQAWQAFHRTAVDGAPAQEVAAELNKSVGAIYAMRSRVLAKIRTGVEKLELAESEIDFEIP